MGGWTLAAYSREGSVRGRGLPSESATVTYPMNEGGGDFQG